MEGGLVKYLIIIYALFIIVSVSYAEEAIPEFLKPCVAQMCVEAKGNVWLRDSPPSGLFYTKGKQLDTIQTSEILIVKDQKIVKTIFRNYRWLNVKRTFYKTDGSKIEQSVAEGWAYNGTENGTPYFQLIVNPGIK